MQLSINRALCLAGVTERYAEEGVVQIPDVFDADTAAHIEHVLRSLPWHLVCQDDTRKNILLSPEQVRAMTAKERQALELGIRARAADNFGYVYLTYPMIQAMLTGWNPGHPIHAVTQFLNSPTFVSLAREVTGCAGILKTDAQASNFGPGHFLTRHIDDGLKRERKAAYTIGFTRKWEPDWGGLLSFMDERMDVSRALIPRFNMLTVFDGLRVHSVSAVADFAPAPRLSIVGWFRDDPPGGGVRV